MTKAARRKYPFPFDSTKAIQAVAVLLKLEEGRCMNYTKLLGILYITDRESIRITGDSITGSSPIAMENGPVPIQVYDMIRGRGKACQVWGGFFRTTKYDLELKGDPGTGRLCPFETDLLNELSLKYRACDERDMIDLTHQFPEWIKNDPGTSSKPIPFEDVVEALDLKDRSAQILDLADEAMSLRGLFGDDCRGPRPRTAWRRGKGRCWESPPSSPCVRDAWRPGWTDSGRRSNAIRIV